MDLYPRGKSPAMHQIGCWTGPRAGLEFSGKKKYLALLGNEAYSFISVTTTLYRLPVMLMVALIRIIIVLYK
jgi:hypothetical protein